MIFWAEIKYFMNLKELYNSKLKYTPKLTEDKLALDFLKNCEKILDIGCGNGRFLRYLPDKMVGLEGNPESVQKCLSAGLKAVEGRATELPFDANTFAGINCSHLIEHLNPDDAYKLLTEINRILKPGGILCMRTPMLHSKFFDEFGHIKPYPPEALLTYLNNKPDGTQTQYKTLGNNYELLKLRYQRANLFEMFAGTPLSFLTAVGNILLRFNISSWQKISYVVIFKKV